MPVIGPGAVVGAVAGAGTDVVGGAVGAVTGGAGHVVSGVVGIGISAVFDAAGQWVASGAVWLLGEVGGAMSATTTVDLTSGWFSAHETVMVAVSAALVVPMVCCAVLQALYRQSAAMLTRTFLVQLPLALLLTGVAVELVQMALVVTDTLSAQVLASAGVDTTAILSPVSSFLVGTGAPVNPAVPAFVIFIGGLLVAVATLVLWLELVVRAAAVSVAVLFLPLALAALVWPAVSHWCRRLADTLAALVLSKLVIAAVLSLAVGALAGGLGVGAVGGDGGGFAAVVTGIALLVIATLSPFTLLRLIPAVEAGAVAHLESARHRFASHAQAPLQARNMALDVAGRMAGPTGGGGADSAAAATVGSGEPTTAMVSRSAGLHDETAAHFGPAATTSAGAPSGRSVGSGASVTDHDTEGNGVRVDVVSRRDHGSVPVDGQGPTTAAGSVTAPLPTGPGAPASDGPDDSHG